jgi:hypothetical protein
MPSTHEAFQTLLNQFELMFEPMKEPANGSSLSTPLSPKDGRDFLNPSFSKIKKRIIASYDSQSSANLTPLFSLLEAMIISKQHFSELNIGKRYQHLFAKPTKELIKALVDKESAFSDSDYQLIDALLLSPLHLKMARKEIRKATIMQAHLNDSTIQKMYVLLDAIIPKKRMKPSYFKFFGAEEKGQALRDLLIEFKDSTIDNAQTLFEDIIYKGSENRITDFGTHCSSTNTINKIVAELLKPDNEVLRRTFFGSAFLTVSTIKQTIEDIIQSRIVIPPCFDSCL